MFSRASDVWALGVMGFELLTGRFPYRGESYSSIVHKLTDKLDQNAMADEAAQLRATRGYSAALTTCVQGMLQKRPRRRATLAAVFASELVRTHARGGEPSPPLADLLEAKAKARGRLPDCFVHHTAAADRMGGAGAAGTRVPRLAAELMGISIVHLACGARHCAVVADSGELFTWGESNGYGQLGHGDKRALKTRRLVTFPDGGVKCVGVACGRAHTLALDSRGALHAWGSDKFGQLGLGVCAIAAADVGATIAIEAADDLRIDDRPRAVRSWPAQAAPPHVREGAGVTIVAVEEHVGGWVTLSTGEALRNPAGGPAPRDVLSCVVTPAPVRVPRPELVWASVACGESHSVALSSMGEAYAWGSAEDGRLGVPLLAHDRTHGAVYSPRAMCTSARGSGGSGGSGTAASRVHLIDCGRDFSALVDEDGCAWGCGANWNGQLGLGPSSADVRTQTSSNSRLALKLPTGAQTPD